MEEYEYDYIYDDMPDSVNTNSFDNFYPFSTESVSFGDITKTCVRSTLYDVCSTYFPVIIVCLLFQITNKIAKLNITLKHFISGVLGIILLYSYFQNLIAHCIILMIISYIMIYLVLNQNLSTAVVPILLFSYLTICEFIMEGSSWARIRNVQMLIVMKVISVLSDVESKRLLKLPSFVQYFGYICCIGNCIFGPWIDYSSYINIFRPQRMTTTIILRILTSLFKSLLFFTVSMCYLDWIWPESNHVNAFVIYLKAMEFRTSHYFIMFMSESFAVAIGFTRFADSANINSVTKPSAIEFPRSLVEVVVFWNIPMHRWLKIYIFKPLRSRYGNFFAIIGTYVISSLLHGLNYQLSGILFSLAIYTFIEYEFRLKLSGKLDACILSKSCQQDCDVHQRKRNHIFVRLINLFFTFVALYHLSYLGFLIDLRVDHRLNFSESFHRWQENWFSSHIIAVITFVISLLL